MVWREYRRPRVCQFRFLLFLLAVAACQDETGPNAVNPPPEGMAAVSFVVNTGAPGPEVPADFLGFGFELPVMADPHLRSDPTFEQLLRNLGPGTLRFGGNSVQISGWRPDSRGQGPFFQLTPFDVNTTFEFARRIGWRVTVALPLTPADSFNLNEAAYLAQNGAGALLAVELGNEPNLYPLNGVRSPQYTVDSFTTEFDAEGAAIRERVPGIPLAGPSTWCTGGGAWFADFLNRTSTPLSFSSVHFYPMGVPAPAGSPEAATVDNMLSPGLMERTRSCVDSAVVAASAHGLEVRVDESNSAFGFGKRGVSDVFASALWALDHLYTLAELGVAGVNVQTGTDINGALTCKGIYLPVCSESGEWMVRPLYYGMLLFHQGATGRTLPIQPEGSPTINLVAHATIGDDGAVRVLLINKEAGEEVAVTVDVSGGGDSPATVLRLVAPSLFERENIHLGGSRIGADGTWASAHVDTLAGGSGLYSLTVPPASAALVTVMQPEVAARLTYQAPGVPQLQGKLP